MRIAVFVFGRFNPPTIGHRRLGFELYKRKHAEEIKNIGAKVDAYFFLSPKNDHIGSDKSKNPLTPKEKLFWAQKIIKFPNITVSLSSLGDDAVTVARNLSKKYDKIVYVSGDDAGQKKLTDAVRKEVVLQKKIFDSHVLKRTTANLSVSGISATLVRKLILDNDYNKFKQAYPVLSQSECKELFQTLAKALYK